MFLLNFQSKEFAGYNVFEEKIRPAMKNAVIKSLLSVQDMIENRKNSFEIYGYDFMIDTNLDTWLIEINSSPSMEYSTVTQLFILFLTRYSNFNLAYKSL